ncbi:hypothetical protein [Synechococcus sp. CBW1006]|uniref:hypothetical protein n=1 Tax=Synechococcus sp. CBW1006 TaxID=1353138 RepID=UPI001E637CB5|nr:hypothetical protein [Synechococcus sp. CBW1006]
MTNVFTPGPCIGADGDISTDLPPHPPDPLAGVWEEELMPLLQRAPALTPITLLEHLQRQKPDVNWLPLQRTL